MKYSLVLRTCDANMKAYNGFVWPEKGAVVCPDFLPTEECGHGFHGFLGGEGDASLADWDPDAKWLVVKVLTSELIHLDGKVKFPRGTVVYCGDRLGATNYLQAQGVKGAIIGAHVAVGDRGTATAGDRGTATAGYKGTATAGNYGTATAGYYGTATAGYKGMATAGEEGTATAGEGGTATAGNYGTATAGYYGTATAGYKGMATAGYYGTATAGEGGILRIQYYDERERWAVAYVGENGILPNVKYRLAGKRFVKA